MTQARIVDDGIEGSSVLATAERTSGYGESSSGSYLVCLSHNRCKTVPRNAVTASSFSVLGS